MIPETDDEHEEWLPRPRKRKRKRPWWEKQINNEEPFIIELEMIEQYCISRFCWEDAKPTVDMLEAMYSMNPPPQVDAVIKRIKRHFDEKAYGKDIKANTVIMKVAKFKSMNEITRNNNVTLGDQINGNEEKQKSIRRDIHRKRHLPGTNVRHS